MPEIKEVSDSESDVPDLEVDGKNVSKTELKARKAMAKLGLKSVPEINRVVIRRNNNSLFVIADADVYKTANAETHIVFGDAKIEDVAQQQAAAQQWMGQGNETAAAPEAVENDEDEEDEDEEGYRCINLVLKQMTLKWS
jgi:nascent polypeptide-associated complex subunit alpha